MPKYVGRSIRRKEDPRFITGKARCVDDIQLPGMLYGAILRSPYAHARIVRIDTTKASKVPGVFSVITGADVGPWSHRLPAGLIEYIYPLARDKVTYSGQEVAAVAAEDKGTAEDAVENIDVEYEEFPVVIDPEMAILPDAPRIRSEIPHLKDNINHRYRLKSGDVDAAFQEADVVVSEKFHTGTQHVCSLETTGCVASYDKILNELTVWLTAQCPAWVKGMISAALGLPEEKIRTVTLDMGGAFGSKVPCFPHYVIASKLSMETGRPVKIILDRRADFHTSGHRWLHIRMAEIAAKKNGQIIGWRETVLVDTGAYQGLAPLAAIKGCLESPGVYRIENVQIDVLCVYTNKTPGAPNRGFGHPQAVFVRERMIDILAGKLGIDPLQLRLKNIVKPDQVPYRSSSGVIFDTPTFEECLQQVAFLTDYKKIREERRPNRGVGIAVGTKNSSGSFSLTEQTSDNDSVLMMLKPGGYATIISPSVPHGQGHETILAQLCAEELGIDIDKVRVYWGDSDIAPYGLGTWGSRTAVTTAPAILEAAQKIKNKMLEIAAYNLEAGIRDIEFSDGRFYVKDSLDRSISVDEVAEIASYKLDKIPPGMEPNLVAYGTYETPGKEWFDEHGRCQTAPAYDLGVHLAVVQVDPETGSVSILDYAVAHDCGVAINPMLVEGQVQGGVVHGIEMALGGSLYWDENGQLINPTLMDYFTLTAIETPEAIKIVHVESPSAVKGGFRGVGEQGTIGVPAAVANAISDALGINITRLPITPEYIWSLAKRVPR